MDTMTPVHKLIKRVTELEAEIRKNRRNYLQEMKAKDEELRKACEKIERLNDDLNAALFKIQELDAALPVFPDKSPLDRC